MFLKFVIYGFSKANESLVNNLGNLFTLKLIYITDT